jgi:hypothetical protein
VLARSRVQRRIIGIALAALVAASAAAAFFGYPGHSRAAGSATQASVNVAVVPGFTAPVYPGLNGVGTFPAGNSRLSAYHFTQLATSKLTASGLAPYDTVILYGLRWGTISASGQAALNAFAATHKVMIWDSDGTGAQNYSTFIHPFSTLASNAGGAPQASVVTFPSGVNFLASDNPSSPYYLDPTQLITNASMINDMNAMKTGTKNWLPALVAQNQNIPEGGWALAWSYGVIGNHTGLTIYSGLDADAINNTQLNPNNEITELLLELKAPVFTTPDQSCAPNCGLPTSSGGGSTHAACSFAKPVPTHWVHGRVPISLKTSVADGITGRVLSPSGRLLAAGKERNGLIHFRVRTRPLRSNHASRLRALVLVSGRRACGLSFRLKVDNTPPRLLYLRTTTNSHGRRVSFRVSEGSQMRISGGGPNYRNWVAVAPRRLINVRLPGSVRVARLILRDRAGNTLERKLVW